MRQRWIVSWLFAAGIAVSRVGAAGACIGDCNGDGVVAVPELILGVRISLGETPLSDCPAFVGPDRAVDISELVAAVVAALSGCPATPTPTGSEMPSATPSEMPTATPTSTPTSTLTPTLTPTVTETPTVPDVSGRWREDPLAVVESTCSALLTQPFAADLAARSPCEQSVEVSSDTAAALVDCTGTRVDGTLERDGTLHFTYPTTSDTTNDCTVALTAALVVPAAVSPTTAAYTFAIAFSGVCPLADCTIDAHGTWTRESPPTGISDRTGSTAAPPR